MNNWTTSTQTTWSLTNIAPWKWDGWMEDAPASFPFGFCGNTFQRRTVFQLRGGVSITIWRSKPRQRWCKRIAGNECGQTAWKMANFLNHSRIWISLKIGEVSKVKYHKVMSWLPLPTCARGLNSHCFHIGMVIKRIVGICIPMVRISGIASFPFIATFDAHMIKWRSNSPADSAMRFHGTWKNGRRFLLETRIFRFSARLEEYTFDGGLTGHDGPALFTSFTLGTGLLPLFRCTFLCLLAGDTGHSDIRRKVWCVHTSRADKETHDRSNNDIQR